MFEYTNIKQRYEKAKQLAEELWLHKDITGKPNDYYYFECGFLAGLDWEENKNELLNRVTTNKLDGYGT